jgi:hypothetical protein
MRTLEGFSLKRGSNSFLMAMSKTRGILTVCSVRIYVMRGRGVILMWELNASFLSEVNESYVI